MTGRRAILLTLALMALLGGGWYAYRSRTAPAPVLQPIASAAMLVNETPLKRYDRALLASIRIFQQATGIRLALVLKERLQTGQTIESLADAWFQQHGLGKDSQGKAMLWVWVEAERQFKIEVSYALEAVFPDVLCHQLEQAARGYMLASNPYARRDFLTELLVTMRLHYLAAGDAATAAPVTVPPLAGAYGLSVHLSGGAGIVGRDYAAAIEKAQALQAPPAAGSWTTDFAPQATPAETANRYLRALREGLGAPMLPLLTEGSRYYRMEMPVAASYAQRLAQFYDKAAPFTVWQQGDTAVAVFQPGQPVLPILMRRGAQGLWRVDEPQAQAYFTLPEEGGAAVQKYARFAYAPAFATAAAGPAARGPLYADRSTPPPLTPEGSLQTRLRTLQDQLAANPADADSVLALAELLHFEVYWLEAAAPLYERVLQLAPARDDIRWRLLDVYTGTSDIDAQERVYRALLARTPDDALLAHYFAWFQRTYPPLATAP